MARNWIEGAVRSMNERRDGIAVFTIKRQITFGELRDLAAKAQGMLRRAGVGPGDHVLLLDLPGPRLYAAVVAILALGAGIVFVEPWMAPNKIDHVLQIVKPKVFLAPPLGKMWGLRVGGIRSIPHWISPKSFDAETSTELAVTEVDAASHAIVTFSSGTSGEPKGIVRTHGYLLDVEAMLAAYDTEPDNPRPDLAIFPNVVLLHLSKGRTTILVPHSWKAEHLAALSGLPEHLQPASAACGPAFLERLVAAPGFPRLQFIGVGGALADCEVLEKAFARFPDALIAHIYGGTEVEPVAHSNARDAVAKSRARGLFQTLFVGSPIPQLDVDPRPEGLWVAGPNVCPEYLGAIAENKLYKRRDDAGRLWHFMGDRVEKDDEGWWYRGRSFQKPEDFADEQAIYSLLGSSKSFIHRTAGGRRVLVGEGVTARKAELFRRFPSLVEVIEGSIARDPRHRARIDRTKSAKKVARAIARVD
ncbi:MAG TPA: class I adenylate-forming enzyme family protein, partial [Polyangiaceae bacterium]